MDGCNIKVFNKFKVTDMDPNQGKRAKEAIPENVVEGGFDPDIFAMYNATNDVDPAAAQDEAGQAADLHGVTVEAGQAAAATTIQAAVRGHLVRKKLAQAAAPQGDAVDAATLDAVEAAAPQGDAVEAATPDAVEAGVDPDILTLHKALNAEDDAAPAEPKNKDNVFIRIFKAIRDFFRNMFNGFTAMFKPGKGGKPASSDGLGSKPAVAACCSPLDNQVEALQPAAAPVSANG